MCSIICICLFATNYIFANAGESVPELDSCFTPSNDNGQPLFLTPYIVNGTIEAAREASKVGNFDGVPFIPSYSGFLTVNQEYNSNIFFWFFPATNGDEEAPVILWLQGGPGATGLMGLFLENGPYMVYPNYTLGSREVPWTQSYHMIFVDNPVGSGFSFTDNEKGYATYQEEIADNLYEFLQQFFILFYEYRDNDLYLSGESYAGKHIPSLAYKIHMIGPSSKINLKGVTMGNPLIHPASTMVNAEYFYQIGLLDFNQKCEMQAYADDILKHIQNNEYEEALKLMCHFFPNFKETFNCEETFLKKYANYDFIYNVRYTNKPEEYNYFYCFIQLPQFRKATHVGNLLFRGQDKVKTKLKSDIMKSVENQTAVVMENYKTLIYNGALDLSITYISTVTFLRGLQWEYANEYLEAERKIWMINGNETAGYIHNVGNFSHAMILGAGHLAPHDKPNAMWDLISRFINGTLAS